MKLEFPWQIFKKILKYQILWKSMQWEPSFSMQTDGQIHIKTDVVKLIVAFLQFCEHA
jgi:hypothetical protein